MRDIAIVKLDGLGDVVRTTALLEPLRRHYPNARLTWITSRQALPLLAENPAVDRALAFGPSLDRQLRATRMGLLISMDEDPRACALAASLPAKELVGAYRDGSGRLTYTASSAPWFAMGRLNRDPDGGLRQANRLKRDNRRSYVEIWKTILQLDGTNGTHELRPCHMLSPEERTEAMRLLLRLGIRPTDRVIGFNPGAGARWPAKRLTPEQAAAIAEALYARLTLRTLLLGGLAERARNRRIAQRAGRAVVDAGTQHPVRMFAALIEQCALLITSDSLALHLGLALRKPLVAFFGPTAAQEVDVGEQGIKLMPSPPCRCFYSRRCRFATSCVDRLGPRRFVEAVAEAL